MALALNYRWWLICHYKTRSKLYNGLQNFYFSKIFTSAKFLLLRVDVSQNQRIKPNINLSILAVYREDTKYYLRFQWSRRPGLNPRSSHTKDFKKGTWYLFSNIRYVSRVKWSNPRKGGAPSPTPRCYSYWKGSLLVALDYSCQLYFLRFGLVWFGFMAYQQLKVI